MSVLPFVDSRRLTGGNLFFRGAGVVLETIGLRVDAGLVEGWRARVARAASQLGWPMDLSVDQAGGTAIRAHASGTALAFIAPVDQLFTATEVNEWALCATVQAQDPTAWADLEQLLRVAAQEQPDNPTQSSVPVLEETAAMRRFAQLAQLERRPALRQLMAEAAVRGLPHILDDELFTIGFGARGCSWSLEALPDPGDVPWSDLGKVPVAVVTGSNGKTTTVRVIAACLRAHGWQDGYSCTDGVFIRQQSVVDGDYSGPVGTRTVLRDRRVEAAAIETARGGILRRGLALPSADVAVVTNVSADHFGEYGIHDLSDLADVKLTVAQLVADQGWLVVNADDPVLREPVGRLPMAAGGKAAIAWFALDAADSLLCEARAVGGATCGVTEEHLVLTRAGNSYDLGPIAAMPLTLRGHARHNVANLAAAALAAVGLGVAPATVAQVFSVFGRDPADNAGRLMCFDFDGITVIVDYAHNPAGLHCLLEAVQPLRGSAGRLAVVLGHAGNRRNEDYDAVAAVVAGFAPDLVVVKETETYLRGRAAGEVPALLRDALLRAGQSADRLIEADTEMGAAQRALSWAVAGDVVVLPLHAQGARDAVLTLLAQRRAGPAPP